MEINVLIVGYKSEPWLTKCIESLRHASQHKLKLCFVDNLDNPTWNSLDISPFTVEVLKTPRPMGFAEANNFGLKNTQLSSKYTVFLNQDTVSTSNWIDLCVEQFEQDAKLGILSPGLRTYDLQEWEPNLAACVRESGLAQDVLDKEPFVELKQVTAAAMLMRTALVDELGGFDPIFGSYYEDYDLCRRVREHGYKIGACTPAHVGHFSGSVATDPTARKKRTRLLIRNRAIHRLREGDGSRTLCMLKQLLLTMPTNLVRGLRRTQSSQPIASTLLAHWDLLKLTPRLLSPTRDQAAFADAWSAD